MQNPVIQTITAAYFMRAKNWNQPKCSSTDEWMNKQNVVCIYKMENPHWAVKESITDMWYNMDEPWNMSSERSWTQKTPYYKIQFIWNF